MTCFSSIIQSLLRFLKMSVHEGFALVCQHGWKSIEEAIVVGFVPRRLLLRLSADVFQYFPMALLWGIL